MKNPILRILAAGLAGGAVINLVMVLTFRLIGFGWNGGGILLNPSVQSQKLIAVWTEMEPLPLVVSRPAPIIAGLILFGVGHAFIYRWLSQSWPSGIMKRTMRFAVLIFFLSFVFWEFFTPFNQFSEPFLLIGLELAFWAVISVAEALVIASVIEL